VALRGTLSTINIVLFYNAFGSLVGTKGSLGHLSGLDFSTLTSLLKRTVLVKYLGSGLFEIIGFFGCYSSFSEGSYRFNKLMRFGILIF
jgi:hypothetical protein